MITYNKMNIGPSEPAVLLCKPISGANRIVRIQGKFTRPLIDFNTDQIEVEVALNDD